MTNFLQSPHFHKQVSDEMKQSCDAEGQKVWNVIDKVLQRGVEEGVLRSDINPIELGVIIWSNITSLLSRIDNEANH